MFCLCKEDHFRLAKPIMMKAKIWHIPKCIKAFIMRLLGFPDAIACRQSKNMGAECFKFRWSQGVDAILKSDEFILGYIAISLYDFSIIIRKAVTNAGSFFSTFIKLSYQGVTQCIKAHC